METDEDISSQPVKTGEDISSQPMEIGEDIPLQPMKTNENIPLESLKTREETYVLRYCPYCGKGCKEGVRFCPHCGNPIYVYTGFRLEQMALVDPSPLWWENASEEEKRNFSSELFFDSEGKTWTSKQLSEKWGVTEEEAREKAYKLLDDKYAF